MNDIVLSPASPGRTPRIASELAQLRPRVVAVLRQAPEGMLFSELSRALGRPAHVRNGWQRLMTCLTELVLERQVVRDLVKGSPVFRLPQPGEITTSAPPVRQVPVPRYRQATFERAVLAALSPARPASFGEVVAGTRTRSPFACEHNVRLALTSLVRAGRARVVQVGAFTRYAAVDR